MLINPVPATSRSNRYPKHTFLIRELPFTVQPFMIAPVRPNDTLTNLKFEARTVSDPVANNIIGWKKEFHFFYVKITDLLIDAIRDMFVDPDNGDIAGTYGLGANDTDYYTAKGGVDFLERGVIRIVDTYFRDEGEVAADFQTAGGLYLVQHRSQNFLDSITDKDNMPEGDAIAGATDAADLERLMNAFETLRALNLAKMDFNDWLRSEGINVPNAIENKPEHLAYFSSFQYPSNTIDPATGAATGALSWVFDNSMRDPKRFTEPGFVIGLSITRPKIYMGGLAGNASAHLTRMWDWLTNVSQSVDVSTRLKLFAGGTGPLGDRTTDPDNYWLDMADLFHHGDQFQNMSAFNVVPAVSGTNHLFPVPTSATFEKWKYLAEADIKQLFATPASDFYVKSDGYCNLAIKGDLGPDLTTVSTAVV